MWSRIKNLTPFPMPSRPRTLPIVLAGFTAFLDLYATQPLLPLLMDVFGASHFDVSLTVTAATVAVALAAPVVGRVGDLIGRRRVIVLSAFVLAGATAAAATAHSLPQFLFWRFVQGLATPGVFATTIAYIHDEWPATYVGRTTAAYISGTVTGGFSGRALVGIVASQWTWQTAFMALALVNLAAATALAAFLPREQPRAAAEARNHGQSVARLLRNRQLIATDAVGLCVLFTQVAMFTYVTFHLSEPPFGLSTAALGWLFVVYLVGAAVTPVAGHWIDARGHRAGLAAGVTIGIAGAVLTLLPWLPAIVAGLAMVATGVFVSQATASSYIGSVTADDRGLAVGLYSSCYYAGGSLGGALPALFWTGGGWTACVVLVVAVQLLTVTLALRFWTRDGRIVRFEDLRISGS
jgi:MFS transporter, YNFM family, putative membrane transport protein